MKRIRGQQLSIAERDTFAQDFMHFMDTAAAEDERLVREGKPAFAKIKALKAVQRTLSKQDLWETLLEVDLLTGVKKWISPYEGRGTLPSLDVRKAMYAILLTLPVEKEHLKRSQLGMTIMAMKQHPEETAENKRTLAQLIEKWCRPIYNKGTDLRELSRVQEEIELSRDERRQAMIPKKQTSAQESVKDVFQAAAAAAAAADTAKRVRVPRSHGLVFQHRPQSRVDTEMMNTGAGAPQEPATSQAKLTKRMLELGKKPAQKRGR
ncbi:hypothetical protein JKP88DRAFT_229318 [Tribonema minus]|uniref:TFIIS N-terminal domain-containing protein n=1 Tax=Tribonema minus TaxID=303371 RepID=A0A835YPY7_9STRA|nr:hypothetical protein JKP88DRAFT_229318 [Tribonema minus]